MAWAGRHVRWRDEKWTRLSSRWMDRFMKGDEDGLPAGRALRLRQCLCAPDDGIAEAISRPWFERWPLLPDGRFDADRLMAGAMSTVDRHPVPDPSGLLVNAQSHFALGRHLAETTWQPTRPQTELLVDALQKARVSPRLARTLLDYG